MVSATMKLEMMTPPYFVTPAIFGVTQIAVVFQTIAITNLVKSPVSHGFALNVVYPILIVPSLVQHP